MPSYKWWQLHSSAGETAQILDSAIGLTGESCASYALTDTAQDVGYRTVGSGRGAVRYVAEHRFAGELHVLKNREIIPRSSICTSCK